MIILQLSDVSTARATVLLDRADRVINRIVFTTILMHTRMSTLHLTEGITGIVVHTIINM